MAGERMKKADMQFILCESICKHGYTIFYLLCIITLGFTRYIFQWRADWRAKMLGCVMMEEEVILKLDTEIDPQQIRLQIDPPHF